MTGPRVSQLAQTGATDGQVAQWVNADGLWKPRSVVNSLNGNTGALKAYETVKDEGSSLTQRPILDFVGSGVTVTDDSGSGKTVVTIPGAGGSATVSSYTPTWTGSTTNPNIGNGVLLGRYLTVDKFMFIEIFIEAGSTTTFGSGAYSFSVPGGVTLVTEGAAAQGDQSIPGFVRDSSANLHWRLSARANSSTQVIDRIFFSDNVTTTGGVSNTSPFTWATGDSMRLAGILRIT